MTVVEIVDERHSEGKCERTLRIPETPGWVEGHFPGFPVVPGFVQLGWAIDAARPLTPTASALRRVQSMKFKQILRPGQTVVLTVERAETAIRFTLIRDTALVSSGTIVFDHGAEADR